MNVSELCKHLSLHPPTVQSYIARLRETMKANVDLQEEISPQQQAIICKEFPDHSKKIIIECDEDDIFAKVEWIGAWNGKLRKAAERTFAGSYKKAMKALQKPERPEGFSSLPHRDAIREEVEKQTREHKEALIAKGRVHADGSIQTDAELAATQPKTSLPLPLGHRPNEPTMLKKKTPEPRPEVTPEAVEEVATMLNDTNQTKNLLAEDAKMAEEQARLEGTNRKVEKVEKPDPIITTPKKVATKKKKAKVTKKKTIKQGVVSNAE